MSDNREQREELLKLKKAEILKILSGMILRDASIVLELVKDDIKSNAIICD